MGQEDRIGAESFQWVRDCAVNFRKPLFVGQLHLHGAHVVICWCTVSPSPTRGPRGSGPGAFRDTEPHSRSDNAAGHHNTSLMVVNPPLLPMVSSSTPRQ